MAHLVLIIWNLWEVVHRANLSALPNDVYLALSFLVSPFSRSLYFNKFRSFEDGRLSGLRPLRVVMMSI